MSFVCLSACVVLVWVCLFVCFGVVGFVWFVFFFLAGFGFVLFHKNGKVRITPKKQADSRQFGQF